MKRIAKSLSIAFFIFLMFSCSNSDPILPEVDDAFALKKGKIVTVTVPFKASFVGEYKAILAPPPAELECGDEFGCFVDVDFEGTGTHLGNFTGNFKFCACGPDSQYGPSTSYMVAANGDSLFVSIEGYVIGGRMDDHPEYVVSYWRDPFVILGGTGRFEGATGYGMSDDYNSSEDPNSHHNWEGVITMIKGKGH